jgi:hypothetical protein
MAASVSDIRYAENGWARVPTIRLRLPRFERVERAHRRQMAALERSLERVGWGAERAARPGGLGRTGVAVLMHWASFNGEVA